MRRHSLLQAGAERDHVVLGQPHLPNQLSAQIAQDGRSQIDQQHLASVHHVGDIDGVASRSADAAQLRRADHPVELRHKPHIAEDA